MPHFIEWSRRICRGNVGPWRIETVNLHMVDPDGLEPATTCGWEFVTLPEGEHPNPRQVPGTEHEIGGES